MKTFLIVLIFFVLFLALIDSAGSTEISNPQDLKGYDRYVKWIEESRVPTPDLTIEIIEKPDNGGPTPFRAFPQQKKIILGDWNYLWDEEFKRGYQRDRVLFKVLTMHEVGHIRDLTKGQRIPRKYYRNKFIKIMGYPKVKRWCRKKICEYYADAYARCSFWPKKLPRYNVTIYDYYPSLQQHKKVCKLIRNHG